MMSQTSIPNIAFKSHEQSSNLKIVENRRAYWKKIISNTPNQTGGKTNKAVTTKLKAATNYNLGIGAQLI